MNTLRLIARLDIKGPNLIKGIHLEGLRVVGAPHDHALRYYQDGADELLYMDAVASLYGRNSLLDIVSRTAEDVFVPLTVGGGIRSVDDVEQILRAGADKVAVNSAAIARPGLITEIARRFGAQCMVTQIDAKATAGGWEAYTDGGREHSGRDAIAWAQEAESLGTGEILLTSIDREGTRKGMDLALIRAVSAAVSVPVIASGGVGDAAHLVEAASTGVEAVAMADILHYRRAGFAELRAAAAAAGLPVREVIQ